MLSHPALDELALAIGSEAKLVPVATHTIRYLVLGQPAFKLGAGEGEVDVSKVLRERASSPDGVFKRRRLGARDMRV